MRSFSNLYQCEPQISWAVSDRVFEKKQSHTDIRRCLRIFDICRFSGFSRIKDKETEDVVDLYTCRKPPKATDIRRVPDSFWHETTHYANIWFFSARLLHHAYPWYRV